MPAAARLPPTDSRNPAGWRERAQRRGLARDAGLDLERELRQQPIF
jgi:hypothetical protein